MAFELLLVSHMDTQEKPSIHFFTQLFAFYEMNLYPVYLFHIKVYLILLKSSFLEKTSNNSGNGTASKVMQFSPVFLYIICKQKHRRFCLCMPHNLEELKKRELSYAFKPINTIHKKSVI